MDRHVYRHVRSNDARDIVMAHVAMADRAVAHIVTAYRVMADIVVAYRQLTMFAVCLPV